MKKLLCAAFMLLSLLRLNSVIHQVGAYYADNYYYDSMCINGNLAYITDATISNPTGFFILDISNPANPVLAGTANDTHQLHDVEIYQNRAYIAAGDVGLQIWDVSTPSTPTLLSTLNLGGTCEQLTISGDKLYASVQSAGLKIYNIADVVPVLLGSYAAVRPNEVSIVGDLAYLADADFGLRIVNVANPAACVLVGSYPLYGAKIIAIQGNILFLGDGHNDSSLLNVSNPANPVLLSEIYDMWIGLAYLQDAYLFVMVNNPGTGSRQLKVYDLTNPSQPQFVSSAVVPATGAAMTIRGDNLYLLVSYTGLIIFDISEIINTSLIVTSNIPACASEMTVVRNMLYIADDEQRILQIDISDPAAPQLVSQLAFPYPIADMAIEEDIAYVTAYENGLYKIRLREDNPPAISNFEVLGNLPTSYSAIDICVSGGLVYLANQDNFQVIDVGEDSVLQVIGTYENYGLLDFLRIAKYHNYVYSGGWSDFVSILDVSNPHNPVLAGSLISPSITEGLLIYDHYLFQSNYMMPLRIYDVENPVYPTLVGNISIGLVEFAIPFIMEHYLFLSFPTANNIKCYDITNPASPVLVKDYYWNLPTYDLFYRDGLLYTCNGDFGFSILQMDLPSGIEDPHQVPQPVCLNAYPNPFSSFITLSYKVDGNQKAELEIYNLKGQRVCRVFSGFVKTGTNTITWDGKDEQNMAVGNGIYIAKLKVGKQSQVKRIIRVN